MEGEWAQEQGDRDSYQVTPGHIQTPTGQPGRWKIRGWRSYRRLVAADHNDHILPRPIAVGWTRPLSQSSFPEAAAQQNNTLAHPVPNFNPHPVPYWNSFFKVRQATQALTIQVLIFKNIWMILHNCLRHRNWVSYVWSVWYWHRPSINLSISHTGTKWHTEALPFIIRNIFFLALTWLTFMNIKMILESNI